MCQHTSPKQAQIRYIIYKYKAYPHKRTKENNITHKNNGKERPKRNDSGRET